MTGAVVVANRDETNTLKAGKGKDTILTLVLDVTHLRRWVAGITGYSLWLLLASQPAVADPAGLRIEVLLGATERPYTRLYTALEQHLEAEQRQGLIQLRQRILDNQDGETDSDVDLLITVGSIAADAAQQRSPTLNTLQLLIPSTRYRQHLTPSRQQSAIFIDQPIERHLRLARLVLPGSQQVGVLLGPNAYDQRNALVSAIDAMGWQAHIGRVPESGSYLPALRRILETSEMLLAIPDPAVYNRRNLQGILLTSYRHEVPMLGFSPGYVRAGALAAVYSMPEQIAQQAAQWIRSLLDTPDPSLPAASYPTHYSVAINHQVARSLGLRVPSEDALLEDLQRLERRAP